MTFIYTLSSLSNTTTTEMMIITKTTFQTISYFIRIECSFKYGIFEYNNSCRQLQQLQQLVYVGTCKIIQGKLDGKKIQLNEQILGFDIQ